MLTTLADSTIRGRNLHHLEETFCNADIMPDTNKELRALHEADPNGRVTVDDSRIMTFTTSSGLRYEQGHGRNRCHPTKCQDKAEDEIPNNCGFMIGQWLIPYGFKPCGPNCRAGFCTCINYYWLLIVIYLLLLHFKTKVKGKRSSATLQPIALCSRCQCHTSVSEIYIRFASAFVSVATTLTWCRSSRDYFRRPELSTFKIRKSELIESVSTSSWPGRFNREYWLLCWDFRTKLTQWNSIATNLKWERSSLNCEGSMNTISKTRCWMNHVFLNFVIHVLNCVLTLFLLIND